MGQLRLPLLLKLKPHIATPIWGGRRLSVLKNLPNYAVIGETWEVSCHLNGASRLEDGRSLYTIVTEEQLPYLIKFIDTAANLSVQVHPDDLFARKHENSQGKTECWIILDAVPGAGIFLGLKKGISRDVFYQALQENRNMSELLEFYPVERGDFFFVPAGAAHAIGQGVFLAEIQQSSGITYRVWDWNRVDKDGRPRELHVDKALQVIRFDDSFNDPRNFKVQKNLFATDFKKNVINHPQFNVATYNMNCGVAKEVDLMELKRCSAFVSVAGSFKLTRGSECIEVGAYESILMVISEEKKVRIEALTDDSQFILVL